MTDLIEKYADSELIVIESAGMEGTKYFVDLASGFTQKGISETYDNYGQQAEVQYCDDVCKVDAVGEPLPECGCVENTVRAMNYHDGNNFRTIIIQSDDFDCNYSEVGGEERADILTALRNAEFAGESTGIQEYKGGNYVISRSQWQGDWALYTLTEKE